MSWGNYILLQKDEKVVSSWKGIWITTRNPIPEKRDEAVKRKETEKASERKKGYLVLTNQRLMFIDEEQTMVTIPLEKFIETWMEKTPVKIDSPANAETYAFRLSNVKKKNFSKFKELIIYNCQKSRETAKPELKTEEKLSLVKHQTG